MSSSDSVSKSQSDRAIDICIKCPTDNDYQTSFKSQNQYPEPLQQAINDINNINTLLSEFQKKYPFACNFYVCKKPDPSNTKLISVSFNLA